MMPIVSGIAASPQQIAEGSPRNGSSGRVTVHAYIDPPRPKPGDRSRCTPLGSGNS